MTQRALVKVSCLLAAISCAGAPALAQATKDKPPAPAAPATKAPSQPAKPDGKQPEKPAMDPAMEQMLKEGAPGEQHKMLEQFAGTWNATVKMWMDPAAPPQESTGVMVNAMILGGRHLKHDFTGTFMNMPFTGMGTWGYDNTEKKWVGTWLDTASTSVMVSKGEYDAKTKTWTMTGDAGPGMKMREVISAVDGDKHTMVSYMVMPDGKEVKSMEITYTRKK